MASVLHGGARTTPRVRAELQASKVPEPVGSQLSDNDTY
jgi:hypothetical protein